MVRVDSVSQECASSGDFARGYTYNRLKSRYKRTQANVAKECFVGS